MVLKLSKSESPDEVDKRIIDFFESFDRTQLLEINRASYEAKQLKDSNYKLLNRQAVDFTECNELENLLLEAIEICRKDVLKRHQEYAKQNVQLHSLKDAQASGQMIMDRVCTRKEDLVYLFQTIFQNKPTKAQIPKSVPALRNSINEQRV